MVSQKMFWSYTSISAEEIRKIHKIVNYERGDTLNIIQGNYEIAVVISQKYLSELKEIMENEKILNIEKNLVSLTLSLTEEFFIHQEVYQSQLENFHGKI